MFLLCKAEDEGRSINALISFGICSTPKESKYEHYYLVCTKQPNKFQYQSTHQDLLHKPQPLFWVNYL